MTSYFNMTDITYGTNDVHTLSIILSNIICWTEYKAFAGPLSTSYSDIKT